MAQSTPKKSGKKSQPLLPVKDKLGVPDNIPLSKLMLDVNNPRFGDLDDSLNGQIDVLNWIVDNFGVEDVINSLAINGYFEAEPLVVEEDGNGNYTVKEGNRRLAACLILANDARAKNHQSKRNGLLRKSNLDNWTSNTEIPVIRYQKDKSGALVAYLGVRHIVSSQPWDSYAKAAWISKVIEENKLTLEEISNLTGDKSQTIAKLLEGFNFVKQLEDRGLFDSKTSYKRGRGSNVSYPFSWIYTVLQYSTVREWLDLAGYTENKRPIPQDREHDASALLEFMFGNNSIAKEPVISDSRQLSQLAYNVSIPERRELLRIGQSLDEIEASFRPKIERLTAELVNARQSLRQAVSLLAESVVGDAEVQDLIEIIIAIRRSAASMQKTLSEQQNEDDQL